MRRRPRSRGLLALLFPFLLLSLAACGDDDSDTTQPTGAPTEVRLAYFANVTHSPALIGLQKGFFKQHLGAHTLKEQVFNAGPDVVNAIFSGAIDIAFIGPNPAINAYSKARDDGGAIRIVSGSTSGGAALVVKPEITTPDDLKGKTLASPQLGGTQDVALRSWLKEHGYATDTAGGGDVSIRPQANADTLTQFQQGQIDGAWLPEPWATRLVLEGGGKVLVDEKDLWPGGQFVTTHIIATTEFIEKHPDAVKAIIEGAKDAIEFAAANEADAQAAANAEIEKATGKPLKAETIKAAWKNLEFTLDPIASSLATSARAAESVDLLDPVDLQGIYDISLLNAILTSDGKSAVKGL